MNNLVVNKIKKSVELMDLYLNEDYDYLELENWVTIYFKGFKEFNILDNTGEMKLNLLVSCDYDRAKNLCKEDITMTELRKRTISVIDGTEEYGEGSIKKELLSTCKGKEFNEIIELEHPIVLRAQTSWDRTDYGCEWTGGGDWEEHTLYGDTTDFYITGIKTIEPYKTIDQCIRELKENCQSTLDDSIETMKNIIRNVDINEKHIYHDKYGNGIIKNFEFVDGQSKSLGRITVKFTNERVIQLAYPQVFFTGMFCFENKEYQSMANDIIELDETIEKMKKILRMLSESDLVRLYRAYIEIETNTLI